MAPHGTADGLIGLAALVQVSATLPDNYIAFELPTGNPAWWCDIIVGLPDPIVKDSHIQVWDTPGLGISFDVEATKQYLREEDADFFEGCAQAGRRHQFFLLLARSVRPPADWRLLSS